VPTRYSSNDPKDSSLPRLDLWLVRRYRRLRKQPSCAILTPSATAIVQAVLRGDGSRAIIPAIRADKLLRPSFAAAAAAAGRYRNPIYM
jgi:hypothetical protein